MKPNGVYKGSLGPFSIDLFKRTLNGSAVGTLIIIFVDSIKTVGVFCFHLLKYNTFTGKFQGQKIKKHVHF
jgi:hypothetical protein